MKSETGMLLLLVTLSLVAAAPKVVLPRLSIGGNLSQSSSVGGSNNTGLIGNIIDNSGNNGVIDNKGEDNRTPASRISIGGDNNENNVIGVNNGSGNIVDNSNNQGDLQNSGQNNNAGVVVRPAARLSIGGDSNKDNVIGANVGSGNIIDNSGNSGNLTNQGQNKNGGAVEQLVDPPA